MKLAREFIRLPINVDADRLVAEVDHLPDSAWQAHPTGFKGNSAVPLISVGGENNDKIRGPMAMTGHLKACEYIQQVLASFKVVFGRSRLMCLGPGAEVPRHCDSNYHWYTRVRIHIPVVTYPEVEFHCHDQMINMAAGEAWIFDNWKMHRVINPTAHRRIHLVADTAGSAAFWDMVEQSLRAVEQGTDLDFKTVAYQPGLQPELLTEQYNTPAVMSPSEVEILCEDLLSDMDAAADQNHPPLADRFRHMVRAMIQDWRKLWTLYGPAQQGRGAFEQRRNQVLRELGSFDRPLVLASNGRTAQNILLARVLLACVDRPIPGLKTL